MKNLGVIALILGISLGVVACNDISDQFKKGKDKLESGNNWQVKNYDFKGFSTLEISGSDKVFIDQNEKYEVRLEGPSDLVNNTKVEFHEDKLTITRNSSLSLNDKKTVNIYISLPNLNKLKIKGVVDVKSSGILKIPDSLEIITNGNSKTDLVLETPKLKINNAGTSSINVNGSARYMNLILSGSSAYQGFDMHCDSIDIVASGTTRANVWAKNILNVNSSGVASIHHKGEATVNAQTSGASKVNKEL